MPIPKPFKRTVRQFVSGNYRPRSYILDSGYAANPGQYLRAFAVLEKDLANLFDYLEPSDINLPCYSFRIHELLMRTCIEVEANLKAILRANGYVAGRARSFTMDDYRKVNQSHRLSSYKVDFPIWKGPSRERLPFANWADPAGVLPWYQAYNAAKHDRANDFERATFSALIDAAAALAALLSAQFLDEDFSPRPGHLVLQGPKDEYDHYQGRLFRIALPSDWPLADCYEFDWQMLQGDPDRFQDFPYV